MNTRPRADGRFLRKSPSVWATDDPRRAVDRLRCAMSVLPSFSFDLPCVREWTATVVAPGRAEAQVPLSPHPPALWASRQAISQETRRETAPPPPARGNPSLLTPHPCSWPLWAFPGHAVGVGSRGPSAAAGPREERPRRVCLVSLPMLSL